MYYQNVAIFANLFNVIETHTHPNEGLDPSRPGFESMDPVVRLDPSDALFVDNYHTAGGNKLVIK